MKHAIKFSVSGYRAQKDTWSVTLSVPMCGVADMTFRGTFADVMRQVSEEMDRIERDESSAQEAY